MTFANGYGISVQWGIGNYCSNQANVQQLLSGDYKTEQIKAGEKGSATAEIAIRSPNGDLVGQELDLFHGDDVEGYCTPERVLEVMNKVAKLP